MTYWRAAKGSKHLKLKDQAAAFCRQGLEAVGHNAKLHDLLAELEGREEAESSKVNCTHSFAFQECSITDFRQAALASFRLAVAADPADADAQCGLGVALLQEGSIEEAQSAFSAAVAADPEHVASQRNLADTCLQLGEYEQA